MIEVPERVAVTAEEESAVIAAFSADATELVVEL
jgi:hypothetical protein